MSIDINARIILFIRPLF